MRHVTCSDWRCSAGRSITDVVPIPPVFPGMQLQPGRLANACNPTPVAGGVLSPAFLRPGALIAALAVALDAIHGLVGPA